MKTNRARFQSYQQESDLIAADLFGLQDFVAERWLKHHPQEIARAAAHRFGQEITARHVWNARPRLDATQMTAAQKKGPQP